MPIASCTPIDINYTLVVTGKDSNTFTSASHIVVAVAATALMSQMKKKGKIAAEEEKEKKVWKKIFKTNFMCF